MIPANFPQANTVFNKPDEMTDEQCGPINALVATDVDGLPVVITCWELEEQDLLTLIRTKRLWVYHVGDQLQPHALTVDDPFLSDPSPSDPSPFLSPPPHDE